MYTSLYSTEGLCNQNSYHLDVEQGSPVLSSEAAG